MEFVEIARAETDHGDLVLRERREDAAPPVLELRANGVFVMDTAETGSERHLARAALEMVQDPGSVLVGGLGLGFTTREVLADPRVEECTVVELEQSLVDWMRDGTVAHGPALLADRRLRIRVADVATALEESPEQAYDVVLLDVDNGPDFLVHLANAGLYGRPFLETLHRVTRGALVIWSATESPTLQADLRAVFGNAEVRRHDVELQGRSEQFWLHVARAGG